MTTALSASAPVLHYSYTVRQPERTIRYIQTYDEAQKQARLSASALQGPFLGFDVEWRPVFVKNAQPSRVALIQIASKDEVLLFQISRARKSAIPSEVHFCDIRTCGPRPTPIGSPRSVARCEHKKSRSRYKRYVSLCLPHSHSILAPWPRQPIPKNSDETGISRCEGLKTSPTLHGNWTALTGMPPGLRTPTNP
jgi:hypothetical protein